MSDIWETDQYRRLWGKQPINGTVEISESNNKLVLELETGIGAGTGEGTGTGTDSGTGTGTGAGTDTSTGSSKRSYELRVPPGSYHTEYVQNRSELVEKLQELAQGAALPVDFRVGGYHQDEKYNVIVLQMQGGETLTGLSGTFAEVWIV